MKREYYESPRAIIIKVTPPKCIMASGENLSGRNYGSEGGEDEDCFWE